MGGVKQYFKYLCSNILYCFDINLTKRIITKQRFMNKKKTYTAPISEVIECDYVTMICGSNVTIDSSNSEEKDWDPNRNIGGDEEYGFE